MGDVVVAANGRNFAVAAMAYYPSILGPEGNFVRLLDMAASPRAWS